MARFGPLLTSNPERSKLHDACINDRALRAARLLELTIRSEVLFGNRWQDDVNVQELYIKIIEEVKQLLPKIAKDFNLEAIVTDSEELAAVKGGDKD